MFSLLRTCRLNCLGCRGFCQAHYASIEGDHIKNFFINGCWVDNCKTDIGFIITKLNIIIIWSRVHCLPHSCAQQKRVGGHFDPAICFDENRFPIKCNISKPFAWTQNAKCETRNVSTMFQRRCAHLLIIIRQDRICSISCFSRTLVNF